MGKMSELEEGLKEIIDYRLGEIGYNDRHDSIIATCLVLAPGLRDQYEWDEDDED